HGISTCKPSSIFHVLGNDSQAIPVEIPLTSTTSDHRVRLKWPQAWVFALFPSSFSSPCPPKNSPQDAVHQRHSSSSGRRDGFSEPCLRRPMTLPPLP
ncbi:hypothetical protein CGCVW01_v010065, partial [Colletotrichum viniferum]